MDTSEGLVGRTVAGYALTTQLSSDLFKYVYLGEKVTESGDKQSVTLKYFHALPLATMDRQQQFLHEAERLKSLQHPYILPIVDYGINGETAIPYIISEFAPFRSLHNRILRQWPQPFLLDEALTIIKRVGEALAYAHEQKIVHGNLSAQSILFNASQEALLTDFDLASLQSDLPPETNEAYLASSKNGVQGDVYALAGILAAMLSSGQTSVKSPASGRTLNSPGNWLPQARHALPSSLSAYLHQALSRALDPEPQRRFASAQEFLYAIQEPSMSSQEKSEKGQSFERTETGEQEGAQPSSTLAETRIAHSVGDEREVVSRLTPLPKSHIPASRRAPRTTGTLAPSLTSKALSDATPSVQPAPPKRQVATDKLMPAVEEVGQQKSETGGKQSTLDDSKRINSMLEQLQSNYASLKPLPSGEGLSKPDEITSKGEARSEAVLPLVALSPKPAAHKHKGRLILALSLLLVICILVGSVLLATQQKTPSDNVSMAGSTATRISEQAHPGERSTQPVRQTPGTGTTTSTSATANATSGTKQPAGSKGTASTNQSNQPTTTAPTQAPTNASPAPSVFYSFEGSGQGWQSTFGSLQSSSQYSYDGAYSLKATISRQSYAFIRAQITQGQTVTTYVYVPSGTPSMTANISIGDGNNLWYDGPVIALTAGQWTRVSYTIGSMNISSPQVGIDLNAPSSVSVYVDAFSWG
ncbi:serine/threonine protein kinase [Ktedonospora formicarum]|uniref:non-specific serine/threonine protein kinase n=1 Tax=Ktedonospora formicarum TaxID=2778364 RepID=A0A8J3MX29_9CHLR|nr:protein kinase [Ktedonospora formicarum]GHO49303.1 hypothetical protein KSX_74660 [Ktedonospora formicarum]